MSSFHPFNRLPPEIRIEIWTYALPPPRLISCYYSAIGSPLLLACHESNTIHNAALSPTLFHDRNHKNHPYLASPTHDLFLVKQIYQDYNLRASKQNYPGGVSKGFYKLDYESKDTKMKIERLVSKMGYLKAPGVQEVLIVCEKYFWAPRLGGEGGKRAYEEELEGLTDIAWTEMCERRRGTGRPVPGWGKPKVRFDVSALVTGEVVKEGELWWTFDYEEWVGRTQEEIDSVGRRPPGVAESLVVRGSTRSATRAAEGTK